MATLTSTGISFSDGTTLPSYADVLKPISQLANFSTIQVSAHVKGCQAQWIDSGTTSQTTYGFFDSNYTGYQVGRGTYYSNVFNIYSTGKYSYGYTNLGSPSFVVRNSVTGGTASTMRVNLVANMYRQSDDTCSIRFLVNGGVVSTQNFVGTYNTLTCTADIPANGAYTMNLQGSILGGSGGDALWINGFYATFNSWV